MSIYIFNSVHDTSLLAYCIEVTVKVNQKRVYFVNCHFSIVVYHTQWLAHCIWGNTSQDELTFLIQVQWNILSFPFLANHPG